MLYLGIFALLGAVIIVVGKRLSFYGDIIGEYKGWEKSWVGILLLASITSMPELITSSVSALLGHPEMAAGNVFGSNMFNIFIVFFLDVFILKDIAFSEKISKNNVVTAMASIILTCVFIIGAVFDPFEIFGFISFFSILILALYVFFMKILNTGETSEQTEEKEKYSNEVSYGSAVRQFGISSVVVVSSGILLTIVADVIAKTPIMGVELGQSFVGVILLAVATSLPELTVSFEAVKIGSYDMAAGNILGSNVFNAGIIFFADLFYFKGEIFERISNFHISSAIFSIIMVCILILGMKMDNRIRKYNGVIIGLLYILFMYLLFTNR